VLALALSPHGASVVVNHSQSLWIVLDAMGLQPSKKKEYKSLKSVIPLCFCHNHSSRTNTFALLSAQKAHSPITIRATNNWYKDVAVLDPEHAREAVLDVGPIDAWLARAVRGQWQPDDVAPRVEVLEPVFHSQDSWRKDGLGRGSSVDMGQKRLGEGKRREVRCRRRSWNKKKKAMRFFLFHGKMWLRSW
jgi:hypothetical protein